MTDPQTPLTPSLRSATAPREADFLRLVACHGGVLVMRQYCAALGPSAKYTFARTLRARCYAAEGCHAAHLLSHAARLASGAAPALCRRGWAPTRIGAGRVRRP